MTNQNPWIELKSLENKDDTEFSRFSSKDSPQVDWSPFAAKQKRNHMFFSTNFLLVPEHWHEKHYNPAAVELFLVVKSCDNLFNAFSFLVPLPH